MRVNCSGGACTFETWWRGFVNRSYIDPDVYQLHMILINHSSLLLAVFDIHGILGNFNFLSFLLWLVP